jgi:hypothetical protein
MNQRDKDIYFSEDVVSDLKSIRNKQNKQKIRTGRNLARARFNE